jgi:hypothetical protein
MQNILKKNEIRRRLYKKYGYEINSTHFEIGSAEMIVKQALRILNDL